MEYLVQVMGSGILQGLVYALIAVSMVIIYKSSEVFIYDIVIGPEEHVDHFPG